MFVWVDSVALELAANCSEVFKSKRLILRGAWGVLLIIVCR